MRPVSKKRRETYGGEQSLLASSIKSVRMTLEEGNYPPMTRTYERLLNTGFEEPNAIELIAIVAMSEFYDMAVKGREHDEVRLEMRLEALPDLSWIDDE